MNNCWFCYKAVENVNYHPSCAKKFFGTTVVPTLQLDDALIDALAKQTVNKRIAVTGVQPKLSLTLQKENGQSHLTIVGLWGEYILKPQHYAYPMMPETEDLTMHIATLFKIPVCEHTILQASNGSMVYIAKRFDRVNGKKIHVEDLCQLSEFLTENKYKSSYEKAGKLVANYCNRGLDTLSYFEIILFSFLCGNNDMHLKNFSLMHQENGVTLSPAYDLLNVNLLNPKDLEELALTINGKKARIKLVDFKVLAEKLNINENVYNKIFKFYSSKNHEVMNLIDRSFLDDNMKIKYKEIWMNKQKLFA
jgi:serine/threonine-protein kinase HipA